jgi:hypothetical protein
LEDEMNELSDEVRSLLDAAHGAGRPSKEQLDDAFGAINRKIAGAKRRSVYALPVRAPAIAALLVSTAVAATFATSSIIDVWEESPPESTEERNDTTPSEPEVRPGKSPSGVHPTTSPEPEVEEGVETLDESETIREEETRQSTLQSNEPRRRSNEVVSDAPTTSQTGPEHIEAQDVQEVVTVEDHEMSSTASREEAPPGELNQETLAEELRLIRDAQQALSRQDTSRALAMLDEHSQRFPNGALSLERAAARLVARCQMGNNAALRAQANRFLEQHRGSPYSNRVETTCLNHNR